MTNQTPIDFQSVGLKLETIDSQFRLDRNRLIAAHPDWDTNRDARLTISGKAINVINSTLLGLIFIDRYLLDRHWWDTQIPMSFTPDERRELGQSFETLMRIAFTDNYFSVFDSSFRCFLRALDPDTCNGATGAFKNIYDTLLTERLSSPVEYGIIVLDLLRLIRNTVHNNGVYFPRDHSDKEIEYKGAVYRFVVGQPIRVSHWDLLLILATDLRQLAWDVVTDSRLSNEPGLIPDPYMVVRE